MPIFEFHCPACGKTEDLLVMPHELGSYVAPSCHCGHVMEKHMSAASFKIKGLRAANGYGLKFIDTPSKETNVAEETGYSFTSTAGATVDHNLKADDPKMGA